MLFLDSSVLDGGLNALRAANAIYLCNSDPANYAAVLSASLGVKNYGAPNLAFAPQVDWLGGRKINTNTTSGTGSATGSAGFWAAVNSSTSTMLAKGDITPTIAVTNGQPWTLPQVTIKQGDNDGQLGATSSAGVFDSSERLVRTLWSAKKNDPRAADPAGAWDGTLDNQTVAPTGNYTVRLLTHDIQYAWEGVVGNSSPNHFWDSNYLNTNCCDMAILDNGEMWIPIGYHEKFNRINVVTTANPQSLIASFGYRTSFHVDSDGIRTYVSIFPEGNNSWTEAYNCVAKTSYSFPAPGNALDYMTAPSGDNSPWINGLAVQKNGNYCFVAHNLEGTHGTIHVCDKVTGFVVKTYTFTGTPGGPSWMRVNKVTDDLWVGCQASPSSATIDTIVKFACDVDGNLSLSGTQITGLQSAIAFDITRDGTTLLVADAGTSQQIKAFNTSNGSVKTAFGTSGAFGQAGGYATSPTVSNTKFMFDHAAVAFSIGCYVACHPDGSWWLGDPGNARNLHFSAGNAPAYIEQICALESFYSCRVCRGDPTRVFGNWLEYKIDYSKPLSPTNGSWTLQNNWMFTVTSNNIDQFAALEFVGVYSNGRTYAAGGNALGDGTTPSGQRTIYELTSSGIRSTGKTFLQNVQIDENFNLISVSISPGQAGFIYKNPFTGFDGSGNPTWQYDPTVVPNVASVNTEVTPSNFVYPAFDITKMSSVSPLANGAIPLYDPHATQYPQAFNNHLGGIDANTGIVRFNTHPPTQSPYLGGADGKWTLFPPAPYFAANGNNDNGGGPMAYLPNTPDIFTEYRGEVWFGGQCNYWSHWHESGLMLGQFGALGMYYAAFSIEIQHVFYDSVNGYWNSDFIGGASQSYKGLPGIAGNCAGAGIAAVNGDYYIYHNDEWHHGGIHRWHVSNLASLNVSTVPVAWNSGSYVPPNDPSDLLAGLPYNTRIANGDAGWNYSSPQSPTESSSDATLFNVRTNNHVPDPRVSPDIGFVMGGQSGYPNQVQKVWRALPRSSSGGDWSIKGEMICDSTSTFSGTTLGSGNSTTSLDILDTSGKIIVRLTHVSDGTGNSLPGQSDGMLRINGSLFALGQPITANKYAIYAWWSYCGAFRPFSIQSDLTNGNIIVSYGDYVGTFGKCDPTADATSPATIQLTAETDVGVRSAYGALCLKGLHYYDPGVLIPGLRSPAAKTLTLAGVAPTATTSFKSPISGALSLSASAASVLALQTPSGIFGANLVAWARADTGVTLSGSNVTGWADQSGNGRNFSAFTTSPTFGATAFNTTKPGITFLNGSTQGLLTGVFNIASSVAGFFIVCNVPALAGGSDRLFAYFNPALGDWNSSTGITLICPSGGNVNILQNGANGPNLFFSTPTNARIGCVYNGPAGAISMYLNNGTPVTGTGLGNNTLGASCVLDIGANATAPSLAFGMIIAEIVMVNVVPTSGQLASLDSYFQTKWGL